MIFDYSSFATYEGVFAFPDFPFDPLPAEESIVDTVEIGGGADSGGGINIGGSIQ